MAPQFVNHGLSANNTLDKSACIWISDTRIRRSTDIIHWRAAYHAVGKRQVVGYAVGDKSYYSEEKYKTGFEIWMKNFKLQFEDKDIERS